MKPVAEETERLIERWLLAGLIDAPTAASIRLHEAAHVMPRSRRWQVTIALVLGGILLGAGVLLFVAAHWDQVSPPVRMALVLFMLVFFHGFGLLARERFPGMATAMHALGTVSSGAAIALVGQIFNMQEHWPAAVMLWALCAAAGWLLLEDQFQQTLTLLLIPAWIASEWSYWTAPYRGGDIYLARFGLVLGIAYLVTLLQSRRGALRGILFAAGALLVPISIGFLSTGWQSASYGRWGAHEWGFIPLQYRLAIFCLMLLAALLAFVSNRTSVVPAAVAAAVGFGLPWLQTTVTDDINGTWKHQEPSIFAYALVALAAVFLVWWGVRMTSRMLVNYGLVGFAITVMWFYFSSVMDKLGRSLGLITLGVLFLAGGWVLEQTRRRLVSGMAGGVA